MPTSSVSFWVSPPYFAYVFAPLSLLPYRAAFALFIVLSALALFATLRVFTRDLYPQSSASRLCFMALQYYPTFEWLLNGQMTGLWLTLYCWVFLLLRRERDGAAGLALGLLVCKPQLALGIAAALLGARRFRALFAALLSGGALVGLGFATLPDAMFAYAKHGQSLVSLVRDRGYNTAGLHGSFEFATLLFDGASPKLAVVAGVCLTLLLLFVLGAAWARTPFRPGTRAFDVRMAATFALAVIASPHLYNYDLMLLMLPLFISVARLSGARGLPLDGGPLLCTTALVWALGLLGPLCPSLSKRSARGFWVFPPRCSSAFWRWPSGLTSRGKRPSPRRRRELALPPSIQAATKQASTLSVSRRTDCSEAPGRAGANAGPASERPREPPSAPREPRRRRCRTGGAALENRRAPRRS